MKIKRLIENIVENTMEQIKMCPAPTQDLELNTANRNRAIKADFIKYGPEIEKLEKEYKQKKAQFKKLMAKLDRMEQY